MAQAETSDVPSILDYLNDDCWRAVLTYVPIRDIVRSESTSWRWKEIVLMYLKGVRIGVNHPIYSLYDQETKICPNRRILTVKHVEYTSFVNWTNKLGTSIVSIYCSSNKFLRILSENCPNLEAIRFVNLHEYITHNPNLRFLRRLSFTGCAFLGIDYYVDQLNCYALKELEINGSDPVTGQCLKHMKSTNLKLLSLRHCLGLKFQHILAAGERLSQLTRLELVFVCREIYQAVHLVLRETPKLKYLNVKFGDVIKNDSFFDAVSRLKSLEYLETSMKVMDENIESVTRHCKELRNLILERGEGVTAQGVSAMCHNAGPRLSTLGIQNNKHLTDDDVITIIRFCANLKKLDVYRCPNVTKEVLSRADAMRRSLYPRTQHLLSLRGDNWEL